MSIHCLARPIELKCSIECFTQFLFKQLGFIFEVVFQTNVFHFLGDTVNAGITPVVDFCTFSMGLTRREGLFEGGLLEFS